MFPYFSLFSPKVLKKFGLTPSSKKCMTCADFGDFRFLYSHLFGMHIGNSKSGLVPRGQYR